MSFGPEYPYAGDSPFEEADLIRLRLAVRCKKCGRAVKNESAVMRGGEPPLSSVCVCIEIAQ